ncbi:MAG: cysteine synthase family protein [Phycisphaeraceae bacterium]|nr:MAG: cysteine synthase family protein [Phycisphaeraceae bacterium]
MDHTRRVYNDVFEMLPGPENPSPLVRINAMSVPGATLYAKLEWMNPFGSVKDRAAWAMIRELERDGRLTQERGIVEPTSGNTGLSLAAMASARGYRSRMVVPNKVPLEKKVLLKIAGADLDVINDNLCPSPGMGDGSIGLAKTHARAQPDKYAMPNQYENEANARAHMETTGPELWRQSDGKISHLFVSLGTCGTATGCARFFRERNPDVKVVAVQPSEGHDVPGLRNKSELHVSALFDESLLDEVMEIEHELAYTRALDLSRREGLLAGPSSGLIYEGARRYAERDPGAVPFGVMIFCDNIFKYVSNMIKHMPELAEGTTA